MISSHRLIKTVSDNAGNKSWKHNSNNADSEFNDSCQGNNEMSIPHIILAVYMH